MGLNPSGEAAATACDTCPGSSPGRGVYFEFNSIEPRGEYGGQECHLCGWEPTDIGGSVVMSRERDEWDEDLVICAKCLPQHVHVFYAAVASIQGDPGENVTLVMCPDCIPRLLYAWHKRINGINGTGGD